jgi:hypothetical protein
MESHAGFSLTQEERVALTFIAHNDPRDGFVRRTWLEFKTAICGLLQRTRQNGWIPVGERLPPLLTEVLGWHPDDRARAWFRHSGTVQGGPRAGTYWESWSPQDRECDDCEVDAPTHWMPLPEPPRHA